MNAASRVRALALVAFVAPMIGLGAQQAPALRDLPRPAAEIEDPFSLVAAVRELSRGRVVVVDGGDGEVAMVNFTSGDRNALGRQGAGPGEYRAPAAVFRGRADTIWVLDPPQQRMTVFLPDEKAGVPFRFEMYDATTRTAMMAPFQVDEAGRMYSSALPIGAGGPNMVIPDSVEVIRLDPRGSTPRSALAKLRFPTSGSPSMRVEGTVVKYTMAFPGLVTADSWAVFPDGRVAIVHGANYSVEFLAPNGSRSPARQIAYDRIPVTPQDHTEEMAEARRQAAEQLKAAQRSMPPGMTLDFTMTPPESWPATYPAIAPLAIFAAPDGMLWVRRSTPSRLGREQWDVINPAGVLVARWRLPLRTRLVGVGAGAAYTVRLDEDDLQYLQRIEVGR